jgi:hypothetical protein
MSQVMPSIEKMAAADFEQALHKATWRNWFSWLTRKSNDLLPLTQIRQCLGFKGQHDLGLRTVPLDRIVGSQGRSGDFDRAFFPRQSRTRTRWVRIDTAYYQDVSLPPVNLVKIGENYFVEDGNHRISVARMRGQQFIDAFVTELDTLVSMAEGVCA